MTTIQFLAEWALRSSTLILTGAIILWVLRVKDSSIRLAAWTAILFASLAIPTLTTALPKLPLAIMRVAPHPPDAPAISAPVRINLPSGTPVESPPPSVPGHFDWTSAALLAYVLVALALLLRLSVGLAISLRLLRNSRATDRTIKGIDIRESDRVSAPVTLGIIRPAIVLPTDWSQWQSAKLDAVLAHERSHIQRYDPAIQLLSAIHRALLWHSPLSWLLHRRIVQVAEEASDDAAIAATSDRALYAELLLEFIQRGLRTAHWHGVPMARYGRADQRIHRILDATALSHGVTRWSLAAILAFASPLTYFVAAAAQPQAFAPNQAATPQRQPAPQPEPASRQPAPAQAATKKAPAARSQTAPAYLTGLGNVVASNTVVVHPRVDGQLMSIGFKEGDVVQQGQVLASVDPRAYQIQLAQAEGQLAQDQAAPQLQARLKVDQANLDSARLMLSYTQVTAPISGIVGLRMIDPGNMVHASDPLVIITQLQPIAVLMTIPEDALSQVRTRLKDGAGILAEAWNRDNSMKLATGRLIAVDNQIDTATGTVKLKAVFDNRDEALFPNQFVNVRLLVGTR
jgi:multidrug efflux pump subunit AcrA (membrane-fusion protein)